MTSERLEAYLVRLGRELRKRGLGDARLIDEAREHLVDGVEQGLQRGLSVDAAEREAFAGFGAPEAIAASAAAERSHMNPLSVLGMVWSRKWWILVPTALTAVLTSVVSYYVLPTRYQSESIIQVVPTRVPAEYAHQVVVGQVGDRLQAINRQIMSRTRLERIISDFGLYAVERQTMTADDLVRRMRNDIRFNPFTSSDQPGTDVGGFKVSFVSSDPKMAMRVAERLASLFVEENLRDREVHAEGTVQFIESQIDELRRKIIDQEARLEELRAKSGGHPLSQADVLPYEVLQETYKTFLVKNLEAKITANLERRQIGMQFRVIDAARVPEQPVGPSRLRVNVMGGFAGLGLGLVLLGVSVRRPRREPESDAAGDSL